MPHYGKFSALSNSMSAKPLSSPRGGFGKWFLHESRIKKRAEPAFTSAKVRHTSKSCSRGRFYAISYTLKNGLSPPSLPPKFATHQSLAHAGDFCAISCTLKEKASLKEGDLKNSATCHSIIGTFLFLPASASGRRTLCESSASAPKCARLCAQPNHTAAARERASRRTH